MASLSSAAPERLGDIRSCLELDVLALLSLLEIPTTDNASPKRLRCPLCRAPHLFTYEDQSRGDWFHCRGCQRTGGLAELAAAVWGCTPHTAVVKLTDEGLLPINPQRDAEHQAAYLGRQRLQQFWQEARQRLPVRPQGVGNLLRYFHVTTTFGERWPTTGGQLVGLSTSDAVASLFYQPYSGTANGCKRKERIFRGRGWGEVLVVAYEDFPGRIAGLFCVGRRGQEAADKVYRHLFPRLEPYYDAGLAGLTVALRATETYGARVLAVNDPMRLLNFQARHAATSSRPLPIVAWYDQGRYLTGRRSWAALGDRLPVFWCAKLDTATLHQAILADGLLHVSAFHTDERSYVDDKLWNEDPSWWLRRFFERARPWRDALALWAKQHRDGEIEDLLLGLEAYGLDRDLVRGVSMQIDDVLPVRRAERVVPFNKTQRIIETNGGWWIEERVQRITNRWRRSLFFNGVLRFEARTVYFTPQGGTEVKFQLGKIRLARRLEELALEQGRPFFLRPKIGEGKLREIAALFDRKPVSEEPNRTAQEARQAAIVTSNDQNDP